MVVFEDLNARVSDEMIEGIVGQYGVPEEMKVVNYYSSCVQTAERKMVVGNSLFGKKVVFKYTLVRTVEEIVRDRVLMDYVLLSNEWVEDC